MPFPPHYRVKEYMAVNPLANQSTRAGIGTTPRTGRRAAQGARRPRSRGSARNPAPTRSSEPPSAASFPAAAAPRHSLALQLPFLKVSESMGNHDSKIVDAYGVD